MHDGEDIAGRSAAVSGLSGQASAGTRRFTNLLAHAEVDSTNTEAAAAYRAGAEEGLVVVAAHQRAGRGRRERTWIAPAGTGLLCSVLFVPDVAPRHFHLLASVVALSARDALARCAGLAADLKWPNDLLVGGKKLAGLLAEVVNDPGGRRGPGVVVGIGINLTWPAGARERVGSFTEADQVAPDAIEQRATSVLAASGRRVAADDVLAVLLEGLEVRYELLRAGERAAIMAEYRARCATIGQHVRVEQDQTSFEADAVGVADDGRLILWRDAQRLEIDTADVVHLHELGRH